MNKQIHKCCVLCDCRHVMNIITNRLAPTLNIFSWFFSSVTNNNLLLDALLSNRLIYCQSYWFAWWLTASHIKNVLVTSFTKNKLKFNKPKPLLAFDIYFDVVSVIHWLETSVYAAYHWLPNHTWCWLMHTADRTLTYSHQELLLLHTIFFISTCTPYLPVPLHCPCLFLVVQPSNESIDKKCAILIVGITQQEWRWMDGAWNTWSQVI